MDETQLNLPGIGHGHVPAWVRAWWRAVQEHYQPETMTRPPTNVELAGSMGQAQRSFDRDKKTFREWIHPKPPRDWCPSWLERLAPADMPMPNGARTVRISGVDEHLHPVLVEEVFDDQGRSLFRRLVDPLRTLAAGFGGYALLDMASDGRLDGVIKFFRVCRQVLLA